MEIFKNIIPDIITKVWLTGVGANSVRPLKSVIPMRLLSCLQTINL